jgi:hypothetical protein
MSGARGLFVVGTASRTGDCYGTYEAHGRSTRTMVGS